MRNCKTIPLTQGKFAIVDEADYDWLNQWKWCYHHTGYAIRSISTGLEKPRQKQIYMHRVITNAQDGLVVDHINGNRADNRICNLRICTHQENIRNQNSRTGSSKYKGVSWKKAKNKWVAYIGFPHKHIGMFATEIEAAEAYNKAAIKIFGEFAMLNKIPK